MLAHAGHGIGTGSSGRSTGTVANQWGIGSGDGSMRSTVWLTRLVVAACLVAVLAACGAAPAPPPRKPPPPFVNEDLRLYYPNVDRYKTMYLEGDNYWPNGPRATVLWFEPLDRQTFRVYNTPPNSVRARCGYDELAWRDDGYLRYTRTVVACGPQRTEIVYDEPIVFLPQRWNGQPWRVDGRSSARYSVDGMLGCRGTNVWTAEVLGVEQIPPGDVDLHWRTTQTTTWTTGDVKGGCFAGAVTRWQEDYWLTGKLPGPRGTRDGRGLQLTVGGNLDKRDDNWDIRMARWVPLPR